MGCRAVMWLSVVVGYTGDGLSCSNVDECADRTHNCGMEATCTDSDPGFRCSCNTGFTGDGVSCTGMYNSTTHVAHVVLYYILHVETAWIA